MADHFPNESNENSLTPARPEEVAEALSRLVGPLARSAEDIALLLTVTRTWPRLVGRRLQTDGVIAGNGWSGSPCAPRRNRGAAARPHRSAHLRP